MEVTTTTTVEAYKNEEILHKKITTLMMMIDFRYKFDLPISRGEYSKRQSITQEWGADTLKQFNLELKE